MTMLEIPTKFGRTFVDYLRMGTIQFLGAQQPQSSRYLSLYSFLVGCVALSLGMLLVQFGLLHGVRAEVTSTNPLASPIVRAGGLVLGIPFLGVYSLFLAVVSRWWPIRSQVSARSVFERLCYPEGASFVITAAFHLLTMPILAELVLRNKIPQPILYMPTVVAGVWSILFWLHYALPGLADLARVSRARMLGGLCFWLFTMGFSIGFTRGFIRGVASQLSP